jgi:hypothetical protein
LFIAAAPFLAFTLSSFTSRRCIAFGLCPFERALSIPTMKSQLLPLSLGALLSVSSVSAGIDDAMQEPLRAIDPNKYRGACPDYKSYAMRPQ